MSLPSQTITAGRLEEAYRRELHNLISGDVMGRLWAKDPSLWPADEDQKENLSANLGWLDLPEQIGPYMARVAETAAAVEREGFQDVVFVALGDSNLAAETVAHISAARRYRRLFVLDTTDPATVGAVDRQLDLERTLFIFASKSGKRIETHALLLYFLHRLKIQGAADPGQHFVAVTQENAYLETLAKTYRFRKIFLDPPGIKGRYSAVIHFGLLFSALCRLDPAGFFSRVAAMRDICLPSAPQDTNPAVALAAFLAAGATQGDDKFLLISTKSLTPLMVRLAQLVGVSMGKGGNGFIPICGEIPSPLEIYQRGCIAAIWKMQGDDDAEINEAARALQQAGVPVVFTELRTVEELGAALFEWELATALACALVGVNPFDEPDIQEGRDNTGEILESLATQRDLPSRTVRVREGGVELYAEAATRQQISTLSLPAALRTFLELRDPDGYLAVLAFVEQSPAVEAVLRRLRERLASKLGIPVLLSFGPRYLHSFGQVYKGGPSKGLFLILTGEPAEDIAIPGAGYTFGQLQSALALGDFESLESRQKPVVRLHLTQGVEQGLAQLERVMQQTLGNTCAAAR